MNYVRLVECLGLGWRLAILVAIPICAICTGVFLYATRVSSDDLTKYSWCVKEIIYRGERLQPNTTKYLIWIGGSPECPEQISFEKKGAIRLPGFNTDEVDGNWEPKTSGSITINDTGKFKEIYEGAYHIQSKWTGVVELVSLNTTIRMVKSKQL